MKLNGTPRHYMPLSQSQSDDEENVPKLPKFEKGSAENLNVHKSFDPQLYMTKSSSENPKYMPMSPLRTVAFVISLLLCVLFIVVVIWLLPCESVPQESLLEKWSVVLENKSVTSGIALARATPYSSPSLVFGYSQSETESKNQYGVIAMQKSDGGRIWQLDLHFEATSILCNVIDVNNDGCTDCLVIGKQGLMTAVDAKTGNNLWYLHSHSAIRVADSVSLPTILPDCNGDSVPELAVSYTFSIETTSAYMGLISGGTGEVIGSPVPIRHCISPVIAHSSLTWKNKTTFLFYCTDGKAASLLFSYAQDFCDVALNRTEHMKTLNALYRAIPYYPDVQLYKVSEHELIVTLSVKKIILVTVSSDKMLKVKWVKHLKEILPWRAVAHGHFLEGESSQLVLISTNESGSKVMGLSLSNGSKVWSAPFYNSTVTSAFCLPNFFRDVDGIVLKLLTYPVKIKEKGAEINATVGYTSASNSDREKLLQLDENFQAAEESYVLLHSGKSPQLMKISVQEVWHMCKGSKCQPDIYTRKETAVAALLNNEEVDMSVISTSLVPSNVSRPLHYQTTVKLLKLEKFSRFSKCMYKLSS